MSFLPVGYEPPATGAGYFEIKPGLNKVRILTDAIVGWSYWDNQKTNHRFPYDKKPENPQNIQVRDNGKPDTIKHFWVFVIWSYAEEKTLIWECTQRSIQKALQELDENPDWGHPGQYDITIKKEGEKLATKYTVTPSPGKPLTQEMVDAFEETPINLYALYNGDDPFDASQHSHNLVALGQGTAAVHTASETVIAMVNTLVNGAKAAGIDVRKVCQENGLPIVPSQYDEEKVCRLEVVLDKAMGVIEIPNAEPVLPQPQPQPQPALEKAF